MAVEGHAPPTPAAGPEGLPPPPLQSSNVPHAPRLWCGVGEGDLMEE